VTKRERALFKSLKRLRDAIWDHGNIDPETVDPRLNRAYMSADGLIGTIEREQAADRARNQPANADRPSSAVNPTLSQEVSIEAETLSEEEVIAHEARFLIDRLHELDWSDLDITFRDFCGHVEPSISRLEGALDRRSHRISNDVSEGG
jgi:hypothetical protein